MKLVIQNTSHVWGGNEKWLATVAEGLADRRHHVVVSCASGPVQRELASRGIATSPFRPRGAIDFVSGITFSAWLKGQEPDALLLTSWRPTAWAVAAARAAGVKRIAMRLGIVRAFPALSPRAVALRSVDAVIANSEEIRDEWNRTAPAESRNIVKVVLNGVRSRLHDRPSLRAKLRKELGIDDDTIVVGGAGHVEVRKGFDFLLRAFATSGVERGCVAILGDGSHRRDLERLAVELGIVDKVKWLGQREDGAGIVAAFDLFVLSSHNEGMANVMLEAMAGGTPVIASNISGVQKAIAASAERRDAGWIVPPADVGALADALRFAIRAIREDPESVAALVDEAHWRAEHWFSPTRMVSECETILFVRE